MTCPSTEGVKYKTSSVLTASPLEVQQEGEPGSEDSKGGRVELLGFPLTTHNDWQDHAS